PNGWCAAMRGPTGRHGGHGDQAAVIGLRGLRRRAENALASPQANVPRCPVGVIETSAALAACLLALIAAVALDRRPYRPGKRNYVPIMIIAVAASLVLGRHLLSLMAYN